MVDKRLMPDNGNALRRSLGERAIILGPRNTLARDEFFINNNNTSDFDPAKGLREINDGASFF